MVNEINQIRRVFHKYRNMKKCYFCGSGTHMLNSCKIRDTISRYPWFDSIGNVHSRLQQEAENGIKNSGK